MKIAQEAFDFIIKQEVTSEAYYRKHYQQPEWPGVNSGVTIGIGYDLGQQTSSQIQADWAGLVPGTMLAIMKACAGITGEAARGVLQQVKSKITIPWEMALKVFSERDVPHWTTLVQQTLPNTDRLSPLCLGVLVSLAYNRGASFHTQGDRYREMRAIHDLCAKTAFEGIPFQIESMKRLWPNVAGLRNRRQQEADLFRKGLKQLTAPLAPVADSPPRTDPSVIITSVPDRPARTPPPPSNVPAHAGAAATAAAGAAAASTAAAYGLNGPQIAAIIIGFAIAAGLVWAIINWWRHK